MRTYTQEEKQAVIDRVISGELSTHILADTGIPKSTFYGWLRAYREEQEADNRRTVSIRNFHLLENKVARLESIVEILKSAPCTPKAPLRQRLYAAEQLYGKYNVHVICDAFDIPRGTFYNHVLRNKKDNTWYAKRREELRLRIQEIYDESNQIFGAAKIAAVMKSEGFKVSNEMVRTLMRYSLVIPVTSGHLLFQTFAAAGAAVQAILAILVVAFTEGIVLCFLDHDAFSVHEGFRHNAGDDADSLQRISRDGDQFKIIFHGRVSFHSEFPGNPAGQTA